MPATLTVKMNDAHVTQAVDRRMQRGVQDAGEYLTARTRQKISRPNPTGESPSGPGEPPKRVTGELYNSIRTAVRVDGKRIIAAIGASARHARFLEFGTSRMAARPFMRPALQENRRSIFHIVARG